MIKNNLQEDKTGLSPKLIVLNSIKLLVIIFILMIGNDSSFFKYFHQFGSYQSYLALFKITTYWLLGILSIFFASYAPNRFVRIVFTILFFITTLSSFIYRRITGDNLNYEALTIIFDNLSMANSVFSYYWTLMIFPFIVSTLTFFLLLPPPAPVRRFISISYRPYVFYLIVFLPFTVFFVHTVLLNHNQLIGTFVQYETPADILKISLDNTLYSDNNARSSIIEVPLDIVSWVKPNTVLIVDESVRGDYLNKYSRDSIVMPFLSKNICRAINFGLISSGANNSVFSNCILRFGTNPENISQTHFSNSYIWEYAKRAGYKVIYIEGQVRKGYNNRMNKRESKCIDEFIYAEESSNMEIDKKIASMIVKIINIPDSFPVFVFVVKAGIHFPYENHVPNDKRIFSTNFNGSLPASREDLINSYKNSLNYCIDPFFKTLLSGPELKNTVFFYTSDHGQTYLIME